jgi:predicted  nucleic acid-binding Zn-ribbon protein
LRWQFADKIAALVAELDQTKAQLEAVEEKDFQKGISLMKLEEALAKSNAEITSNASMHSRDMAEANHRIICAQEQSTQLQQQLDSASVRIESLSSELASATEAQQLSATQASNSSACYERDFS